MRVRLASLLVLLAAVPAFSAPAQVRLDAGKLWIECRGSSLEEVLTKIAAVAPMELWIEEEVKTTKLSASISGEDMQTAFAELMERAPVNYVLYFHPRDPKQITKIYVGGGSAQLALRPRVEAPEPTPTPYHEMAIEDLLMSTQGEDAIEALRQALQEQGLDDSVLEDGEVLGGADFTGLPEEIQRLLPQLEAPAPPDAKKNPRR